MLKSRNISRNPYLMKTAFYLMGLILISYHGKAQQWWAPRAHLQVATDAALSMASLQPGIGAQLSFSTKLGIAVDYYHFSGKYRDLNPMWPAQAYQKHHTIALMGTLKLNRRPRQGMYLMAGMAYQRRRSGGGFSPNDWIDNRSYMTPAIEFGYRWPTGEKGYGMAVSFKATGPLFYSESTAQPGVPPNEFNTVSTLEILTQLSIGLVVDRRMLLRRKR